MILTVDIGNTGITLGVFENEKLIEILRTPSNINMNSEEYRLLLKNLVKKHNITGCIVGSVVEELDTIIQKAITQAFKINPIMVSDKLNTGVGISTEKPSSVGADRIANACAAYKKYSAPAIVVDLGTAITFDIIDNSGNFSGGIIMPGLETQLNSLFENTSKLPKLNIEHIEKTIGTNTKECILSGVVRGTACAIEGLIIQCKKELNSDAVIIATGGHSEFISKYITSFDYIEPHLTLEGLKYLYDLNLK